MSWRRLLKARPTVEDLTHLIVPGWTGGTATLVRSPGGAITLHVNSLTRDAAGEERATVLTLPPELRPVENQYGDVTYRGLRVRVMSNGAVRVDDPVTILDYFSTTFVPRGGA